MIREEKHAVHCQGCYFWEGAQVLGYGRLDKMVQGKDTLNKNQSIPCWRWLHGPLFFIHQFLRFVLFLLLHQSGKIAIPHDHLFFLPHILHLILSKSLQLQGELIISGDSQVVLWWAVYGNLCLSFLKRADIPFVRNGFVAIYFNLFFTVSFEKISSLCCNNVAMIASFSVAGEHLLRYRAVPLTSYMVRNVNVNVNNDLCFTLSCELVGWPTILGFPVNLSGDRLLPNIKRWNFSTAHMPGRWWGGRWREKCQLGRYTNQRWGTQAQTHHQYVLAQWFFDITELFPETTVLTIIKLALRTNEIKI